MTKSLFLVGLWLALSITATSGCAGKNLYHLHPDDARVSEALEALRASGLRGEDYDRANRLAWATWFLTNDTTHARQLFDEAIRADSAGPEARAGAGIAAFLQADIPAAQVHFLSLLEMDPQGPYGELAATELRGIAKLSADFPDVAEGILARLYDGGMLSHRTRQLLREMRAVIALEHGDLEGFRALDRDAGKWTRYALTGPFGAFGLLDFDTAYPPEGGEPLREQYSLGGTSVATLPVDLDTAPVGFSDLSDFGGVYYATGHIRLEQEATLVVRLETENLAQVLIDGHTVLVRDIRRAYPEGLAEAGVRLGPGWHRLQVKFGLERASGQFNLFLTDDQGRPVAVEQHPALDESRQAASRAQTVFRPVTLDRVMEQYFLSRAQRAPDFFTLFMAVLVAGELNLYTPLKEFLARATAINDRFAPLHVVAALSLEEDPAQPGTVVEEFVRASHTRAVELDPTQAFARSMGLAQKLNRDQVREALADLDLLIQQSPDFYMWPMYRFNIFRGRGWIAEADQALQKALLLNPRNPALLSAAIDYYRSLHRYTHAEALVTRLDALDPRACLLAHWRLEAGDLDTALEAHTRAYEEAPGEARHAAMLTSLYQRRGQVDKAIAVIERAALKPGKAPLRQATRLSELYRLANRPDDARRVLEDALGMEPRRFPLRRQLAFLDSRGLLDAHVTDGLALIREFEAAPYAPDDASVIVLDEYIRQYFPDGSGISRVHTITRLQTREALDQYGEVNRPGDAIMYHLRVIKPDGRILVPDRISGKRSVTLPHLEIGDYVEMDYVTPNGLDTRLEGGRLDQGKFYFRMVNLPVYLSNVVILHPEAMPFHFLELNAQGLPPARVETADGWVTHHYRFQRLAPIRTEPFMPMEDEVIPILYHSRPVDWPEIRDFHRQRLARSRVMTPELRAFLSAHRGKEKGVALVQRLYTALAAEIQGDNADRDFQTPASHVLLNRRGNRLLVLSTLLAELEVPNEFILARPQNAPDVTYASANLTAYDEPLLRVRVGDKTLYLTSELETSVFNLPSPLLSGSKALVLSDDEEVFTHLPNFTPIGQNKEVHLLVRLDASGNADCDVVERAHNYYSGHMRRALKQLPRERVRQLFEMQIGRDFPGATLLEYEIRNLDDPQKPLELAYRFTVRQLAREQAGVLRLPLGFFKLNLTSNYIRTPAREYDMLINGVNTGYHSTVLVLPPERAASEIPAAQIIETPFGRYEMTVEQSEGNLVLSRDYTIPIQRVTVKDFVDFYRFCAQVDHVERSELVLKKR